MESRFLQALGERILIGDGAMGTRIYEKGVAPGRAFDELNLSTPHLIRVIHREYIQAGSDVLETNTFSANRIRLKKYGLEAKVREINEAGARIAREAAGKDHFVAGSVGPLTGAVREEDPPTPESKRDIFAEQIGALAEGGADVILLETFTDLDELKTAVEAARQACSLPVVCMLAFTDRMKTPLGVTAEEALRELEAAGADVVGANCTVPFWTQKVIEWMGGRTKTKLAAYANAGMPEYVDGRFLYLTTPDYFARIGQQMVRDGANLVGGCCGTGPEHIAALAAKIKGARPMPRALRSAAAVAPEPRPAPVESVPTRHPRTFADRLGRETLVVVELDPPRGLNFEKVLQGARTLRTAGVDAITVGDNPLAVVRMGNIGMAHLLEREGIPTIAHLSCRDKNLIALQSTILEAAALDITSLLAITGDPAKVGDQPQASSVYDLNSFELIRLIAHMNEGKNYVGNSIQKKTRFVIGSAFNPNVRELERQVRRLKKKVEAGAHFALPQPLYDIERIPEMYRTIRDGVGDFPVFFGVLPAVSLKNAEFLAHEVPGITIPESLIDRLRKTPADRQREEGICIAKELIDQALDHAPGFYIIPPFNSIEIAAELVRHIRTRTKPRRQS